MDVVRGTQSAKELELLKLLHLDHYTLPEIDELGEKFYELGNHAWKKMSPEQFYKWVTDLLVSELDISPQHAAKLQHLLVLIVKRLHPEKFVRPNSSPSLN